MEEQLDLSQPVARTIRVLEYFAQHEGPSASLIDVAEGCDIAPATVARIVKTLAASGYLIAKGRGYTANYRITPDLAMPESYLTFLDLVLEELTEASEKSGEVICLSGSQLHWHSKIEHDSLRIRIRAKAGYRRGLKQLDAISRLALSIMPKEQRELRFDPESFLSVSSVPATYSAKEAIAIIEGTDPKSVVYDLAGNIYGVRRFARLILDDGKPVHMICIAEAALMVDDVDEHIQRNTRLLENAAGRLEAFIMDMRSNEERIVS